jgi:STE24 endopeptidase
MAPLTAALIAALALTLLARLLLLGRQAAHVRAQGDHVPAAFAQTVDLPSHRKAAAYTVAKARLGMVGEVVHVLFSVALLLGGLTALDAAAAAALPPGIAAGTAFLLAVGVLGAIVDLPLEAYATFKVEAAFGFNRTTLRTYLLDLLKGAAVNLVLSGALIAGALWLMDAVAGLWWLYAWAGLLVLSVTLAIVYPLWLAPLFNTFTPLPDGEVRRRIEALMARCGFTASGLFVMDASRRSAHGNAYFTGFGKAKRIVLFDTLLDKHTPAEIEAVLAHELGHFKHRHILVMLLRFAVVSLAALAAFGYLTRQPWLLGGFGMPADNDAMALALLFLCLEPVGLIAAPLFNGMSRRAEFQADAFASRTVGAEPLVAALTRLTRDNAATLTPDPLYALVTYSHPPVPLRVHRLRADQDAGESMTRDRAHRVCARPARQD